MYKVPLTMPKHCNNCPYGHCEYNKPFWSEKVETSNIDGNLNKVNTYGYVCTLDFNKNGRYTKVFRAIRGEDIPRQPELCLLREVLDDEG